MSGRRRRQLQSSNREADFEVTMPNSTRLEEGAGGSTNTAKINFNDIEGIIKKFTGDETMSVQVWLQDFESYAETFRWTDLQRYVFCKRSLSGTAKLYIECEAKPRSYSQLKASLYAEFKPRISAADVHSKMATTRKSHDESCREYLYKMIDIASQAEVDVPSIISYVIQGINDSANGKAILYGSNSIQEFKEKLIIYEKIKKSESQPKEKTQVAYADKNKTMQSRIKSRYCFNCGSREHEFHMCPQKEKGPKCFGCNDFDHKRNDCPKATKSSLVNVVSVNNMCVPVKVNRVIIDSLLDTGSDICVIKESVMKIIKPMSFDRTKSISVAGLGSKVHTKGVCKLNMEINGEIYTDVETHIVNDRCMKYNLLLGASIIRQAVVKIEAGKLTMVKKSS
ncbi:uncharacterized protein LOC128869495 isoform X2 [Anastrepha ludens]|uniref:uncharacterized protein LOC128869495 isoform X2 n=1 Tax=Anastrepha ludens TaxID=28586 RepID=UPI0023AF4729|nr:uncharacterized protein LOC128869495 isoform X2 [Anastrepha ludens]